MPVTTLRAVADRLYLHVPQSCKIARYQARRYHDSMLKVVWKLDIVWKLDVVWTRPPKKGPPWTSASDATGEAAGMGRTR
jgi:hypothetical protein